MTNFKAQTNSRKLRLDIYDVIGADFVGNGITAKMVSQQIAEAGEDIEQIEVHINSPGGDAFDGIAIYNQLKQFPGQVNVFVDGVAASAASVIAMAGDQRVVNQGGSIMIHNASGFTFGDKVTHTKQARTLGKLDKNIATIYAEATGGDAETIAELMTEETWLDADDALADGFATQVAPTEATASPSLRFLNFYDNVPLKVAAMAGQSDGEIPNPANTETPTMADETTAPEENEEVVAEEVDKDEMIADLQSQIASLEEELEKYKGMEEEDDSTDEDEDAPTAKLNAFINNLVEQNTRLAELANGSPELALANGIGTERDDKTLNIYKAAIAIKNDDARESYLNSIGADINDYDEWANTRK